MFGVHFRCGDPVCGYVLAPFFAAIFIAIVWDTVLRFQAARKLGNSAWSEINSIPQFEGKVGKRLGAVAVGSMIVSFGGWFICAYLRCGDVSVTLPTHGTTVAAAVAGAVALTFYLMMYWYRRRMGVLEPLPPGVTRTYEGPWAVTNWLSTVSWGIFLGLVFTGISGSSH